MKITNTIILFFLSLLIQGEIKSSTNEIILTGLEASTKVRGAEMIRMYDFTSIPAYVKFSDPKIVSEENIIRFVQDVLKLPKEISLQFLRKETDELGFTHYRYIQTYKGYEVFGTGFVVHIRNGYLWSMNGMLYDYLENNTANITEKEAFKKALDAMNASVYKWQIPEEEEMAKHEFEVDKIRKTPTYFPTGKLQYTAINGDARNPNANRRLAYSFDIYAHEPMDRNEIFVDASTGEILFQNPLIMHGDANGTAVTAYSGIRPIVTDSVLVDSFRLREIGRGQGIQTFNLRKGTNYGLAVDFRDSNNYWNNVNANKDQYATDAHWGSEMTYDYFFLKHGRNGIDNAGFLLKSYIHYSTNYTNAFWDGSRMTYGDGAAPYTPLVAMDIAGHEIAHGLTNFTSNLTYAYESGALNESFSDIFGVAIDFYSRPTLANYQMGDGIGGSPFRSMINPRIYNHPRNYLGQHWYTGTGDNGGVHINSGVQNHWFYLLSEGGIGRKDNNDSFWVHQIGMDTAGKIAFRNNTVYLTASSNYADARFYAIQSAIDLYGACTSPVIATTNAWHAVGVGPRYDTTVIANFISPNPLNCVAPQKVNFINLSINSSSFRWFFGNGDSSTLRNPSEIYTADGSYTVTLIADGGRCGKDTIVKTSYILLDRHNDCIYSIGDTMSTQCNGILYDDGGLNGNYNTSKDLVFNINPVGATSNLLRFGDFDVESTTSACSYDYLSIYNGTSTASPIMGSFCNAIRPPVTPLGAGPSVTTRFFSDPFATGRGFEMQWQCQLPSAKPNIRFSSNITKTCSGIVAFRDQTYNNPTSWLWSFGDGGISTSQNPIYTYNNSGVYTVQLIATNAFGSDTFSKTNYIEVNKTSAPVVSNPVQSKCGSNSFNFNSTASGILEWVDSINSINVISIGNNFTTPILSTSKDYYLRLRNISPTRTFGPLNTLGTGGNLTSNNAPFMVFDAIKPFTLNSVTVVANGARNRRFQLMDKFGIVIRDTIINVGTGTQTVNLNFSIQEGRGYRLGIHRDSVAQLYRNTAGASYPYSDPGGAVNIIGHTNSANARPSYFFFYNWTIKEEDCISTGAKVTARVQMPISLQSIDTMVCSGSPVVLTPKGNNIDSIYWTTGNISAASRAVMPTSNSNYIYTAYNFCGSKTDTANILVTPLPIINAISNDTSICAGRPLKLKTTSTPMANWTSLGIIDSVVNISPSAAIAYPILVSNVCGTVRDTIIVSIKPNPVIIASNDTTICNGSTINLSATSVDTITWLPMNQKLSSISINPTTTTQYIAEGTNSCGFKRDTVNVIVISAPTLLVSNDTLICNGNSVSINGVSGEQITWQPINITSSTVNVNPSATTSYYANVTNICGSKKDTVTISILNKPAVLVSQKNVSTCKTFAVNLSASATSDTIRWYPGGLKSNNLTFNADNSTLYYAEAFNICGVSRDTSTIIVDQAKPTITKSKDSSICIGNSVQLSTATNGSIFWPTLGQITTFVTVTPTSTTFYPIHSSNNCGLSKDSIRITVLQVPTLVAMNDTTICEKSIVKLRVTSTSAVVWQPGNFAGAEYEVRPDSAMTFTATSNNICGNAFRNVKIGFKTLPKLTISSDTSVCQGKSAKIFASSDTSFYWQHNFSLRGPIVVTPSLTTQYTAFAVNACGKLTKAATVNVKPRPIAAASPSFINGRTIFFNNQSSNGLTYRWFYGDGGLSTVTNPTYTYKQDGSYDVVLVTQNTCGQDTSRMNVKIGTNGIQATLSESVQIYPVPAKDVLNVDIIGVWTLSTSTIDVYDNSGRKIISKRSKGQTTIPIQVSNIARGIYQIVVTNEHQQYTQSFIID